ncbi:MAG: triose-phosphate isomerase [Bacillota bacterium]|nr:triose-phosphate isomerase [Bacillota bacterium]
MEESIKNYIKNLVRTAIEQSVGTHPSMARRKKYVIANWKMNKNLAESAEFFQKIICNDAVSVVICPPTQLLYPSHLFIKQQSKEIGLGAQNVHWAEKGAYTGETSVSMLQDVGCEYVIIGHSERRQYAAEDDETVCRKVKQAIKAGLIPIICIGESLKQKQLSQTEHVLSAQLSGALKDVTSSRFIVAYEPIWAIGTGQSATAEQAQQIHAFIRSVLTQLLGQNAEDISILYGGSANEKNVADFCSMPDIDGVLVGGASLDPRTFNEMIQLCAKEV